MKIKNIDSYFDEYGEIYDFDEEYKNIIADNSSTIVANLDVLPQYMGQKVVMHWFSHTLPFKRYRDLFRTSITVDNKECEFDFTLPTDSEFCRHNNLSDWFVVPFKDAKRVQLSYLNKHLTELETPPNWYELFIIMNDLIWKCGRHIDIAITGINFDTKTGTIEFDMSS